MREREEDFLRKFEARARQLSDEVVEGELPPAFASLELLLSFMSAREIAPEKLTSVLPVKHWREQQVSVPVAWLMPVVRGWLRHRLSDGRMPLGVALSLRGKQGSSPTAKKHNKKDRDRRLANLVVVDYIASAFEGNPISIDAACAGVAEGNRVGERVVQRAYMDYGARLVAGFNPHEPKLPELLAQASDRKPD